MVVTAGSSASGWNGVYQRLTLDESQEVTQGSSGSPIRVLGRAQATTAVWSSRLAATAVTPGHQTNASRATAAPRLRLLGGSGGGNRPQTEPYADDKCEDQT